MLTPPTSSRKALRNLLIVLVATVAFLIYSYGWTVTDIDLVKPQESARQEGVTRALQELLSPNLFDQDSETDIFGASFRFGCETGELPEIQTVEAGQPLLTLEPTCGEPNDRLKFTISNLPPNARAGLRWMTSSGEGRPRDVFETEDARRGRTQFFIGTDGAFSGYIEAPRIVGTDGEVHRLELGVVIPIGSPYASPTLNEVLRRMVETIFMALMATTISIPISVAISFFAAHNLMKPIKMQLGSAMLWLALLPFSYLIGAWLLGDIGRFAFNLGSGAGFDVVPAILSVGSIIGIVALTRLKSPQQDTTTARIRQIVMRVLVMIIMVLAIGFIGGFGIAGMNGMGDLASRIDPSGDNLLSGILNSLGRMIGILGGIVELGLPVIAGVIGAFAIPGLVSDLVKPILRNATGLVNYGIGAVLGAISGAFAMAIVAFIAMGAALLGLLPPLIASLLGRAVVAGALNRFFPPLPAYQVTNTTRLLRTLAGWAGAIASFYVTFLLMNVGRTLIDGTLPPIENATYLGVTLPTYVLTAMAIGAVLGGLAGGLSGIRGSFAIGDLLYNVTRNVLNALRSIEPLIMALIFVVWVGIGPFAGVLALTLHSIASLGKLYSEQIETIDNGPIEALQSTGANHLQTIIYAVVPQIVPPYIAFTMYRWDINVRMSTIIGFVGGGGIGLLLNQYINLLRYSDAGVAVLAIAVVVAILDYASARIRERIL
jgi:phosphonate ABC transporter permease subunit PhnE